MKVKALRKMRGKKKAEAEEGDLASWAKIQ